MNSIKGHTNNTLEWKLLNISTNQICTRAFARLEETAHYEFCKLFFEKGESKAISLKEYCPINIATHKDLFYSLPKVLDKPPIWWLMPWGGVIRKPNFLREARISAKNTYTERFLKLLKSIEKKGFILDKKFLPPVHHLRSGNQSAFILQDGHHRSAVLHYLLRNNQRDLIHSSENNSITQLKVKNEALIRREYLPYLKYVALGSDASHFTLSDAYKWFDHPFNVLKIKTNHDHKFETKLASIHDKILKLK